VTIHIPVTLICDGPTYKNCKKKARAKATAVLQENGNLEIRHVPGHLEVVTTDMPLGWRQKKYGNGHVCPECAKEDE